MIIVKLLGGLGNQMFQYAMALKMAHLNNDSIKMDLRGLFAGEDIRKEYELDIFKIEPLQATRNEYFSFYRKSILGSKILWDLLCKIKKTKTLSDPDFVFHAEFLKYRGKNLMLRGLFQSEKYFSDIRPIILEIFKFPDFNDPKNIELAKNIVESNSVSLHIRRGEFSDNDKINQVIGTCDIDYYKNAINTISEKITEPTFFIFSDDPDWVIRHIVPNYPSIYIQHNKGKNSFKDMQLMSLCKHNIIANSTFSWWAAWLNQNPDKLVIAPQQWFAGWKYDTKDLIPKNWIKL